MLTSPAIEVFIKLIYAERLSENLDWKTLGGFRLKPQAFFTTDDPKPDLGLFGLGLEQILSLLPGNNYPTLTSCRGHQKSDKKSVWYRQEILSFCDDSQQLFES